MCPLTRSALALGSEAVGYIVALFIDTGGREPHRIVDLSVSYNLRPYFHRALGPDGLTLLDGIQASQAAADLQDGLRRLHAYGLTNPSDELTEAVRALQWIYAQGQKHPKAYVFVR